MDFSAILGLATSGASMFAGRLRKGGSTDAWQTAAETYGLLLRPASFWKGPKLSGLLSGNELTVDIKDRNTASAATRFRLGMRPLNLGWRLKKRGFWNSLRPRILTGDSAFDNQVVIEGHNDLAVQQFLTPERRKVIQGFLGSFKGAAITDSEIAFRITGDVKKADDMLGAIDAMTQVASVLESSPRAATVSRIGSASAAMTVPQEVSRSVVPEPSPVATSEFRQSNVDEADVGLEVDTDEVVPTESAVSDVLTVEPDGATEPKKEASPAPESGVPSESSPSVEEFCATVFAPGALSFAANQKFKASYEGQRIAWTGTLNSITPFTFDFDFGTGRGTKAVLTVLKGDGAGSRDVQAVIGLPSGVDTLYDCIGQPIAFEGRLHKVDGLAKRIVIADAALLP